MKKLFVITAIILLAATVFGGCSHPALKEGLVTVDVTANYPEKELVLQDFMDVEYIPLETTDDFLTQGQVLALDDNVIVTKNFVNDGDLFFFDRKGKALRKINRRGEGGEEYTFALSVALDDERGELFVDDHYKKKIFVYDLEGNFKRSFDHKESTMYDRIFNFDRDNLICHDNFYYSEETANMHKFMVASKDDGSITKDIQFPRGEEKIMVVYTTDEATNSVYSYSPSTHYSILPYPEGWILSENAADTFYRFTSDYTLTPFVARTPSIQSMDPEVFLFMSMITERYYFMETVKKVFNFATREGFPGVNLVYDKQEKAIYQSTVYNGDYSDKKQVYMNSRPGAGKVASWQIMQSDRLVEDFKEGKLKGRLAEVAAGLDEESNPVIMLIKHRK
ncbi:MAG: 6-bladed beta-propeller [Tannerellaceae bacterium]|nr:6-bladed beta-propeller [Tannerellaceae bacterium]